MTAYDPKSCVCGHAQAVHTMDMRSYRLVGACNMRCECLRYRPEKAER